MSAAAAEMAHDNAYINTSNLNAGTHSITASYSGDLSYNPSNAGPIVFSVELAPTTIAFASNSSSISNGETLILIAVVSTDVPANANTPGGSVTFTDTTNNTVLCSSMVTPGAGTAGAQCVPTTTLCFSGIINAEATQFVDGANSIVASYSGDGNFSVAGPSPAAVVTCTAGCSNASGQSLTLSFGQQSSGNTSPGGTITTVVSVGEVGGFTGAVNLTCSIAGKKSGDKNIPTCSFGTPQVNLTINQSVNSTLTIKTTAATASALRYPPRHQLQDRKGCMWRAAHFWRRP